MKAELIDFNEKKGESFLLHKGYEIHKGQYGYWNVPKKDEESKFIACGSAVWVKEICINIETMERTLKLKFYDCVGNGMVLDMPRSDMTEQNILNLTKFGVQVNKRTADVLIKCLENQENKAPMTYQHKGLGFGLYGEEYFFKGFKAIGMESKYVGELSVEPHGSCKKWKDMVKKEVLGTSMEIILASALSATVIDFIHPDYQVDNVLLSLVGNSSSGKTTALNLAVSTGSLPAISGKSLMLSFIDTELSIIHKMSSGFPVAIDEFTALGNRDMTRLLYTIANGSERSRMNQKMDMVETNEFHTSVLMSSECSILSSSHKYEGLRVRVLEFENIKWTTSGDSADRIKKACLSNYGWAVPKLAKYLLGIEKESLIQLCEEWSDDFLNSLENKNALATRMSKKIGIILATAQIAEKALGLVFDLDMIEKFFCENLKMNPEDFDIGIKAYEAVMSYVAERPKEFGEAIYSNDPRADVEYYYRSGKIKPSKQKKLYDGSLSNEILFIKEETFDKILESKGFRDSKVILRKLRELGLLVSDNDRFKSKARLGQDSILIKGYRLRIRNCEQAESDSNSSSTNNKKKGSREL